MTDSAKFLFIHHQNMETLCERINKEYLPLWFLGIKLNIHCVSRNLGLLAGEGLPCEPLSLRLPLPPRVVRYIYITCFIYDLRTSCYTLQVPPEEHPDVLDHLPDHGPGHRAIPGRLQVTRCLYNIYHRFTCLCPLLSYCSMLLLSYHQCSVETWLMMECYCMVSK